VLTCALRASSSTSNDCLLPLPVELPCLLRGLGLLSKYSAPGSLLGLASLRLAEGSGLAVRRCLMGELVLRLLLFGVHISSNRWVGTCNATRAGCASGNYYIVHVCTGEKVQVSAVRTGLDVSSA
jgi:hypothetical protein